MLCRKCHTELVVGANYCHVCGANVFATPSRRTRGNGTGSAYKRGKTWTATVVLGWKQQTDKDGEPVLDRLGLPKIVPIRRTKGGFATKNEALAYCATLKGTPTAMKLKGATFAQIFDEWSNSYWPRLSESSIAGHKAAYKLYEDIYYLPFADLCTADLQACVDACGRGKRTRENMKSLASLMYEYAAQQKVVTHNYAKYIFCGREDRTTRPGFSSDELAAICDAVGKIPYADYIKCMCYTGFRPNEMLSLKRDAYDAEHVTLTGGNKTEAGKNRPVTLSPKIAPIVAALVEKANPYIFPRADGKLMTDAYFREYCFYPLLARLGIQPIPKKGEKPKYTPYTCRHTFANLLKNVPGSDTDKAGLMGHADASMTKDYQSPDYESIKAITDKI